MKTNNILMNESTQKEISINIFDYNTLEDLKTKLHAKLKPYLLTLINKEIMKKDGTLLKKYSEPLNNLIKEFEQEHKLKPFKSGYWIKLNGLFLNSSSYSLKINIRINYKYGETYNKRTNETRQDHKYLEGYLYLLDYENETFNQRNETKKVKEITPKEDFKPIDLKQTLKEAEKVLKLRFEYEKALNKIEPYTTKETIKKYYFSMEDLKKWIYKKN